MYRIALILERAGVVEFNNSGGIQWNKDYDFEADYENGVVPIFKSCTCDKSTSKDSE